MGCAITALSDWKRGTRARSLLARTEAKFEDLDGNVLWLGTEPRDDLPLEDE